MKYSFDEVLDESKYGEIKEISVDKQGTTRLFVSLGKKDGLTAKKLLKMINNETKVPSGRIKDIRVLDAYSFLTAPFRDAELILRSFKRDGTGLKQALVKKANDSNDGMEDKKKTSAAKKERRRGNG